MKSQPTVSKKKRIEQSSLFEHARLLLKAGALNKLKGLLEQYPELVHMRDIPDGRGIRNTLLHEATGMGDISWPENIVELVEILIYYGADVNVREHMEEGETPLHHAVSVNNVEVAEVLLKHGADPEQTGRYDGSIDTALGYALYYSLDERLPQYFKNSVELLLDFGVGYYLPFAAALNDFEYVTNAFAAPGILKTGMGRAEPDLTIQQAFFFACRHGHTKIAAFLLENGAKVNQKIPFFNHNASALHLACEKNNQTGIVKLLLERGANRRIKDDTYNATAEGWAMFCGQDEVYRMLRKI